MYLNTCYFHSLDLQLLEAIPIFSRPCSYSSNYLTFVFPDHVHYRNLEITEKYEKEIKHSYYFNLGYSLKFFLFLIFFSCH